MKKLFFTALIVLAGLTACGTKSTETASTEATEQRKWAAATSHTYR